MATDQQQATGLVTDLTEGDVGKVVTIGNEGQTKITGRLLAVQQIPGRDPILTVSGIGATIWPRSTRVTTPALGGPVDFGRETLRQWSEDVPQGQYVPMSPKAREIWTEMAAAVNRLVPEIKADAEKVLVSVGTHDHPIGDVLAGDWPPYIRRASGRIAWARPIRSML